MSNSPSPTLVLFDFDGTLTTGDSLREYLLFAAQWGRKRGREGRRWLAWRRLLAAVPRLAIRLLRLLFSGRWSNGGAKESVIAFFFAGKTETEMRALAGRFFREIMPTRLRGDMLALLRQWRDAGATVAVVSASLDLWLEPFCRAEAVRMVCTRAEFAEGRFTGRFATPNCNYSEKARRIRAAFELDVYGKIVAYGNSRGDAAMFALAHEAWLCRPDGRLLRVEPRSAT